MQRIAEYLEALQKSGQQTTITLPNNLTNPKWLQEYPPIAIGFNRWGNSPICSADFSRIPSS